MPNPGDVFFGSDRSEREKTLLDALSMEPYNKIPARMLDPITRYVMNGTPPGGFLTAVITNNLLDASTRADKANEQLLRAYAQLFWWWTPRECHGSVERMEAWMRYCADCRHCVGEANAATGLYPQELLERHGGGKEEA